MKSVTPIDQFLWSPHVEAVALLEKPRKAQEVSAVELERFVVEAKRATYVGGGVAAAEPDRSPWILVFRQGDWLYRDSYFGGSDFLGQEVVWFRRQPRWAMNYHGYIRRTDLIDAARAGATIKAALPSMYAEGDFWAA